MGIAQNFNRNLKKAVKDQTHNLPSGSKFIFQQLLKNANQIEENLEDDNVGKDKGKGYYCRCADGTLCHSNNSSCYGRCCVGEPVMAEGEEELEMDEDCGDGEMYEGGCGGEMYEDSGAFESNYFNSLQGIRTSDVYKESIESLIRKNLKESQKNQIRKWSR